MNIFGLLLVDQSTIGVAPVSTMYSPEWTPPELGFSRLLTFFLWWSSASSHADVSHFKVIQNELLQHGHGSMSWKALPYTPAEESEPCQVQHSSIEIWVWKTTVNHRVLTLILIQLTDHDSGPAYLPPISWFHLQRAKWDYHGCCARCQIPSAVCPWSSQHMMVFSS